MNRRCPKKNIPVKAMAGLTFVEIMVTVCVLSLGVVFVHQSFFRSLLALEYSRNLVLSRMILEEKMWEGMAGVRYDSGPTKEVSETLEVSGQSFLLSRSIQTVDLGLYAVTLVMSWKDAVRAGKTAASTYVAI
jgi:Tfp pilus assembly protein PilV